MVTSSRGWLNLITPTRWLHLLPTTPNSAHFSCHITLTFPSTQRPPHPYARSVCSDTGSAHIQSLSASAQSTVGQRTRSEYQEASSRTQFNVPDVVLVSASAAWRREQYLIFNVCFFQTFLFSIPHSQTARRQMHKIRDK